MERMGSFRDRLENGLASLVPGLIINGWNVRRLPNTSSLTFPHVYADKMQKSLSELCFSTSAASLGRKDPVSPMLSALGLTPSQIQGTIRLSVGRFNTEEQISRSVELLVSAWENCIKE